MNFKDISILIIFSLFIGMMMFGRSTQDSPQPMQEQPIPEPDSPNVQGQTALFIGDSHTANHQFGWQKQLCQKTGMIMKNVSAGGKTTDWMLNEAVYGINDDIDHLFIYGGANDMYSNYMSPEDCIVNIQKIVNLATSRGIKTYVLTGFDPNKVVRVNRPKYIQRYTSLQELMLQDLKKCVVIDIRNSVDIEDCADALCHMKRPGHRKIANTIINTLRLKTLQP